MGSRFVRVLGWLALSGVVATSSPAALPPPEFPKTATASPTDAADRYAALVEHFQPRNGRDARGPNAWKGLIAAAGAMREVDVRVWRDPAAGVTDASPDFALVYDPPEALADQDKRNLALSLKLLDEYEKAGVFALLGIMPGAPRAVRARVDSAEYRAAIGAAGGDAGEPWDGKLVSILLPELGSTRALTRVNVAVMQRAAEAKDVPRYVAAFEQTLAMARVCAHQPGLIDRLVADAIAALVADRATKTVRGGWHDPALLDALEGALDRQTRWPSIRLQFEGERLLALDACRWALDKDGRPDIPMFSAIGAMSNRPFDFTKLSGPVPTRDETVKAINDYFDRLVSVQAPSAARRAAITGELNAFLDALPRGQLLVRMLAPAQEKAVEADARSMARVAVLRAAIAVEKHKLRTGEYPASFADLVPAVDTNDPWSDLPLRYARTANGYELSSAEADAAGTR